MTLSDLVDNRAAAVLSGILFVFGAIVGSFLNVCITRIPKRESLVSPPSHCCKCGKSIRFYDNVPIISFLILRGRCRFCRERISVRYVLVEVITGVMTAALYFRFGLTLAFVTTFIFVTALIVVSFIDLEHRIVPDVISLPGILVGALIAIAAKYVFGDTSQVIPSPLSTFIGILAGGGALYGIGWIYERVTGVDGMGGGDIKLLAMIGAFLGLPSIPVTVFIGSLVGSVVGVVLMLVTGTGRRLALPFAPFLCIGATTHLFFGQKLIAFYFS
jgi:leader peptidase (prepilin peptidase)/N-methyltransferase